MAKKPVDYTYQTYGKSRRKIIYQKRYIWFLRDVTLNLKHVKRTAMRKLQSHTRNCTLMLLSNLAEPDWISVPCNDKLLHYVVCAKKANYYNITTIHNVQEDETCEKQLILVNKRCYAFIWHNKTQVKPGYCQLFNGRSITVAQLKLFYHIFDAISTSVVFNILVDNYNTNMVVGIKMTRQFNRIHLKYTDITTEEWEGNYICNFNKLIRVTDILTFQCEKGGALLYDFVCDGSIDCPNDNSDEKICTCTGEPNMTFKFIVYQCRDLIIKGKALSCSSLYYMTKKGFCEHYNTLTGFLQLGFDHIFAHRENPLISNGQMVTVNTSTFKCRDGHIISSSFVNDLIVDCAHSAEDESLLKSIMTYSNYSSLCSQSEIPCRDGHSKCYKYSSICILKFDAHHHLMPCRNGGHIQNCESFQCNMMFKCRYSYCIPWTYVCDGKWDCPEGNDELNNPVCGRVLTCVHMYKCKGIPKICIHVGNICDHQNDCPNGDDELFCQLINVKCPHKCICLLFAITCNNIYFTHSFHISFHVLVAVFIFNSTIPLSYIRGKQFESTQILKLAENKIHQACFLQFLINLLHFDLAFNLVEVIHRHCFSSSLLLVSLDLHKNRISYLESESFYNLSKLRFLDIAFNPITIISSYSLRNLLFLTVFNCSSLLYKQIGQNIFDNTRQGLIIINTNHFISCISPPTSICTLYPPWYVS